MKDPRWWLLIVALAAAVGVLLISRGPKTKHAHADCLTDEQCLKTERCFVEPKGDGFATYGQCTMTCDDDLQCDPGWRCDDALVDEGHLVPTGTKGAGPKHQKVCRWGAREGK